MDKKEIQELRDSIKIKCEICGAPNAKFRRFSTVVGLLVISSHKKTEPHAVCDEHKRHFANEPLMKNLLLGWWGIYAFFWNIIAIISNLTGGEDCTNEIKDIMIVRSIENNNAIKKQEQIYNSGPKN